MIQPRLAALAVDQFKGKRMSDASSPVLFSVEGAIALITLNRPESRNPLDADTQDALIAAVARLETEPRVRVAILTGAGSAFSSGGNVRRMGEAATAGPTERTPAQARAYYRHGIQRIPRAMEAVEVPVSSMSL